MHVSNHYYTISLVPGIWWIIWNTETRRSLLMIISLQARYLYPKTRPHHLIVRLPSAKKLNHRERPCQRDCHVAILGGQMQLHVAQLAFVMIKRKNLAEIEGRTWYNCFIFSFFGIMEKEKEKLRISIERKTHKIC